jgi:hypothetical protein
MAMATHHYDRPKTHPLRIFQRVGILVFIGLACLLIGCDGNLLEGISDDDSYEANLEEGLMALDDEDYDKAVDLFVDLRSDYPNKEEVCVYLSNAYAGLTGIDTFNLLDTISELEDTGDEGSIDMIGLLLGNADGTLDQQGVDSKMDLLALAQTAIDTCIDTPDTDERVQAGLLGLGDVALMIADIVLADLDLDSIELTEEGLDALYTSLPVIDQTDISDEDLARLNDSLDDIADSVVALEELLGDDEENDLSESFDEFIGDIDIDDSGEITRSEIAQYIDNL